MVRCEARQLLRSFQGSRQHARSSTPCGLSNKNIANIINARSNRKRTGVRGKICKVESQCGSQNHVGRVADQCGRSACVGGAYFRNDERNRVEFQQEAELQCQRRKEQHDRDAVHEHCQESGQEDQDNEQGCRVIIYFPQGGHRQPGEEARLDKDRDQREHSSHQPQRFPTDVGQRFRRGEHAKQDQKENRPEAPPNDAGISRLLSQCMPAQIWITVKIIFLYCMDSG